MNRTFLLGGILVAATTAQAQFLPYTGGAYSENFDSLPTTGSATRPTGPLTTASGVAGAAWTNGATLPGWNATYENTTNVGADPASGTNGNWINAGVIAGGATGENVIPDYNVRFVRINNGSGNTGSMYNFGATSSMDRALGALNSGGATTPLRNSIVLLLRNDSAQTLTEFTLRYRAEQWRLGATGRTDRMDFSHRVFAAGDWAIDQARPTVASGWTDVDALDLLGTVANGTVGPLDGNANSTLVSGVATGLNWTPGSVLALRWIDFDASGSDDGLAIDDLSIEAVPEPGTMAALGLGLAALARRRRRA